MILRISVSIPDGSTIDPKLCEMQAVRISNDLYGSHILSAFELAKGYSPPIDFRNPPVPITDKIIDAHTILIVKQKLALILRSKKSSPQNFAVSDMVDIWIGLSNEKRGKWTAPRAVISIHRCASSLTVPGANIRTITAALEAVRRSIIEDNFDLLVRQANDELYSDMMSSTSAPTPVDQCAV